jgi:hypothetical protein
MAKLNLKQIAQQTALQGDTDGAVRQLSAILAGGDLAAAASLAEIEAFRGQWPEMLRHAYTFLRKPDSVYASNVFTDILNVVAVAGLKKGGWPDIHDEVVAIRKHLLADPELEGYANGADRMAMGPDQLIELAKTKGESAYVWDWGSHSPLDESARSAKFDEGIAKLLTKKNAFKTDADRRKHFFSLASTYGSHRSAVRLYDQEGIDDLIRFNEVAFTASALARAGRAKEAWEVARKAVPMWWPVDVAQMAPVALLTDEGLRPLMTPERCEWVLGTPRGPAAVEKKKK